MTFKETKLYAFFYVSLAAAVGSALFLATAYTTYYAASYIADTTTAYIQSLATKHAQEQEHILNELKELWQTIQELGPKEIEQKEALQIAFDQLAKKVTNQSKVWAIQDPEIASAIKKAMNEEEENPEKKEENKPEKRHHAPWATFGGVFLLCGVIFTFIIRMLKKALPSYSIFLDYALQAGLLMLLFGTSLYLLSSAAISVALGAEFYTEMLILLILPMFLLLVGLKKKERIIGAFGAFLTALVYPPRISIMIFDTIPSPYNALLTIAMIFFCFYVALHKKTPDMISFGLLAAGSIYMYSLLLHYIPPFIHNPLLAAVGTLLASTFVLYMWSKQPSQLQLAKTTTNG